MNIHGIFCTGNHVWLIDIIAKYSAWRAFISLSWSTFIIRDCMRRGICRKDLSCPERKDDNAVYSKNTKQKNAKTREYFRWNVRFFKNKIKKNGIFFSREIVTPKYVSIPSFIQKVFFSLALSAHWRISQRNKK